MTTQTGVVRVVVSDWPEKHWPIFLSVERAARIIGVSRPTILRMIERKELNAVQASGSKIWRVGAVSVFSHLGHTAQAVLVDE